MAAPEESGPPGAHGGVPAGSGALGGQRPLPASGPTRALTLVRAWCRHLQAAGIDTARLDAELLVAHAAGIDRSRLFVDDPLLEGDALVLAEALLERRGRERVPVAYLVGERWFDGLAFQVSEAVLVPRPETELLVEFAAALAPAGATTIDVGTGSGAVAVALAVRRPDLLITASDIDGAALAVAAENIERLIGPPGPAARPSTTLSAVAGGAVPAPPTIALQHAPLLGAWSGEVVVSNPPYVEQAWLEEATPELAHEPQHALYAGPDGLDVIEDLVRDCANANVGLILLEHGYQQGAAVRSAFERAQYRPTTEHDLAGRDRITWALRRDLLPPRGADLAALRARWT